MRRFLTVLLGTGLLASACASDNPTEQADQNGGRRGGTDVVIDIGGEEIVLTSALSGFSDCSSLLDHLRTEGAERVGPYGFNEGWFGGGGPWMVAEDVAVDFAEGAPTVSGDDGVAVPPRPTAAEDAASLIEGVDFSGTNVQESDVDEADIVKTDGERVYIVANSELVVVDVETRTVIGSIALATREQTELFLHGDDIVHITYGWWAGDILPLGVPVDTLDAEAGIARDESVGDEEFWDGPSTVITRISVADASPRILESINIEGEYVSSRAVDGSARIIMRSNPQQTFPFVYPAGPAGEDRATDSNREALMESTLSDWLPEYTSFDANGSQTGSGLLSTCESVHAPTEFAGFGVLSVLTVPVNGTIDPSTTSSVLAPGSVVYSSPESIYVATTAWFDAVAFDDSDWQEIQENRQTSIHRFDISSPSSAAYTASGSVAGDIRDSFSMSEHDGHLRVITTTGDPWADNSETFVRVLRESEGELVEVGSVGDMGRGEAVQSVRFQGDVAYVVTFEQVDPLYTLDLSDPQNPQVRGELKIPGFSSYLHPIGEGLVLGVGSDADQDGRVTGTKVSLFDVSDLDNPEEIATWIGPDGWNNVGSDPHAFLWWAPENLAVVPMELWDRDQRWSGAVVLEVTGGQIREVGRIDHAEDNLVRGQTECDTIGPDDLPTDQEEFKTELEWMISEGGGLVLICEEGETPSATGYQCNAEPWITQEAEALGLEVNGEVVLCWDQGNYMPAIARSIVLSGDELWTVSSPSGWLGGQQNARLQVNDLSSLERLDVVIV